MSSKPKKQRAKEESREKPGRHVAAEARPRELSKPRGPVPQAQVMARHEGDMVARLGRGFSMGELDASQLPFMTAKRWNLPLDLRRRTVLDGNVTLIKGWAAGAKPLKREGEVKKIEAEVVKVEKEVKKEVKKEATKAAKEVKKVEKKVEKKVAEEVEKPVKKRAPKKKAASKSD